MTHIGNMDQTMCRFDMAPNSTNNIRGERDIRIATTGGAKIGFTVALTALADGTKLPAFIVFKVLYCIKYPLIIFKLQFTVRRLLISNLHIVF